MHDSLFWPRWVKDVGQLYFRALGWNVGTARELGGAAIDAGKYARSFVKGEIPDRNAKRCEDS